MQLQMFGKRHLFDYFISKMYIGIIVLYCTLTFIGLIKKDMYIFFFASDFFFQIAIYLQDRQIHFLF